MKVGEIARYFDIHGLFGLPSIFDKIGEVIEVYL